jgi:small subunit ribosomal protein S18
MRSYECAVILHPAVNDEGLKASAAKYVDIIAHGGGEITKLETWGKRRLSYEIMRQPEGHYYFYRFRGAESLIGELGRQLRIDENVLRHLIVRDETATGAEPKLDPGAVEPTLRHTPSASVRRNTVARDSKPKKKGEKREKREKRPMRKKKCKFCLDRVTHIDYKDERRIRRFMTDRGKITPRRITGTCAKHQRMLATAVKRARLIALVPYVREYYR